MLELGGTSPPPPARRVSSCSECPILQQVACERGAGHCLRQPGVPAPRSAWLVCDRILAACRTHNAPGAPPAPPTAPRRLSCGDAVLLEPLAELPPPPPPPPPATSLGAISSRLRARGYTTCVRMRAPPRVGALR
jgi:hypothetical protein